MFKSTLLMTTLTLLASTASAQQLCSTEIPYKYRVALTFTNISESQPTTLHTGNTVIYICNEKEIKSETDYELLTQKIEKNFSKLTNILILSVTKLDN